jgi:hypothetical protein
MAKTKMIPQLEGTSLPEALPIKVKDLFLDPKNPRLTGDTYRIEDQDKILKRLWNEFNVSEITDSIVASKEFWKHEPLIAAREEGELAVIEGNRRLAAVKLLVSPALQKRIGASGIPKISDALSAKLTELPVIESPREKVWDFIGFKHVNGPQEWDSIAKAEYISRIHEDYGVPLPVIAKSIGDRNATVERLYHGLKVLHQAQKSGVFDPLDRFYQRKDFAYSHLWTGLGYEGIRKFLGISNRKRSERDPIPSSKVSALGELCGWLYGSHKDGIEPLIKSQNPHLRQLDEALRTQRGVSALRRGLPLQQALNASRGDTRLLLDALVSAEQNLRDAKAYFSTGYGGQQEIEESVNNVFLLSESLRDELKTISRKK